MEQQTNRRKFPRINHVSSRQIIRIDRAQNPQFHFILTENLSGCGLKFTTNEPLETNCYFLIYLNDVLVKGVHQNKENLIRTGDYYLCHVIRCVQLKNGTYEIGASFLEKKDAESKEMETFTELVNASMLNSLPDTSKPLRKFTGWPQTKTQG